MSNITVFQGELQLTAWGESSNAGAWVKFWVHPEDLEHFKLLQIRSGQKAGQRLAAVMVQIGDGEQAVVQTSATAPAATPAPSSVPKRYHPPSVGARGMLAVRWCKLPAFLEWMEKTFEAPLPSFMPNEKDQAKRYLCIACDIDSRKRLDTDPEAGAWFDEHIRIPFRDYLQQQGIEP